MAAYSIKYEHKQRVHGRPIAGWPISTHPNMVKKMFDWSPEQSAKFNNSAASRVPQSPLLRLTVTSAYSHELDHNCPCAQPFVLPALPGKVQARCPTRLSGTAAHGSVSLSWAKYIEEILGIPRIKKNMQCMRHSGFV